MYRRLLAAAVVFALAVLPAQAQGVPPESLRIRTPAMNVQSTSSSGSDIYASTVITNTTASGEVWVIERSYTYGEAAIVIVLMARVLIAVFDIVLRLAVMRV